jgi:hypothetical protein
LAFPHLFSESIAAAFHPGRVFANTLPWPASDLQITSFGDGSLLFLQWDDLIGSTALLLWAAALYIVAHQQTSIDVRWTTLLSNVALLSLVSGLVGAAVVLMWARDEVLFQRGDVDADHDRK